MLDSLLSYTDWLMNRVTDACRALPAGLFTAPTIFPNGRALGNGSLRDTFLHMAMIEHRWVGIRLLGQPYRPTGEQFPPHAYPDPDRVMDVWRSGRALTQQWLSARAAELDTPQEMQGIFGQASFRATPRDLLTHALTHTISHRGDITSQLSFLGVEPPILDYVIYAQSKNT